MTDKLTPLDAEASEDFERNRQSSEVVQHKCTCGAWYETQKGNKPFRASFQCEACGLLVEYDVPAHEARAQFIATPTTEDILSTASLGSKLDTGMKPEEAISRARQWWEKTGAKQMRQHSARQKNHAAASSKGLGSSFASGDPGNANFLPSGILLGKPWDDLNKREKIQIVKIWHHFAVRMPDKIGKPDEAFSFGPNNTKIQ